MQLLNAPAQLALDVACCLAHDSHSVRSRDCWAWLCPRSAKIVSCVGAGGAGGAGGGTGWRRAQPPAKWALATSATIMTMRLDEPITERGS